MDRRSFLRGVVTLSSAVTVAGCTGPVTPFHRGNLAAEVPTAHLDMRPLPDDELPGRMLYSVPAEETDRKAKLVERIRDGSATVERTRPPLPTGRRISYGDGVYELDHTVVEETPATTYSVKVDILQSSPPASETIAFTDLPAVDRQQFAEHGLEDGDPVGIGTTFLYTDAERERSVLVPESRYSAITWANGAEAEWVVDGSYESVLKTFEYSGEQVMSASAYGRRLRERFAFSFEDLSVAEREIVETATGEDRFVVPPDEEPPDAVRSLAERFRRQDPVRPLASEDEEGGSTYLVQYEGDVYWTSFSLRDETTATP